MVLDLRFNDQQQVTRGFRRLDDVWIYAKGNIGRSVHSFRYYSRAEVISPRRSGPDVTRGRRRPSPCLVGGRHFPSLGAHILDARTPNIANVGLEGLLPATISVNEDTNSAHM
jgi:hypothetical protein